MARQSKLLVGSQQPQINNLPQAQQDIEALMREHAGEGTEHLTAQDLLIPRLTILQALSPQVTQGKPEFDPNARTGQIYDVGMKEGWPDGIMALICYSTRSWNEWAPRHTGRGIVARHENPLILQNCKPGENGLPTLPNGNTIVDAMEFYLMNLSAKGRKSFISMSSTQLKEARRINNYISEEVEDAQGNIYRPPIYYRVYRLSTVSTSNAKGTWFLWKAERGQKLSEVPASAKLFAEARSFRESLIKGQAKADMSETGEPAWDNYSEQPRGRRNEGPL